MDGAAAAIVARVFPPPRHRLTLALAARGAAREGDRRAHARARSLTSTDARAMNRVDME